MTPRPALVPPRTEPSRVPFSRDALREAIDLVRQMDPIGVGARDLRECLLAQLNHLKTIERKNGNGNHHGERAAIDDAIIMVDQHLHALQNKNYKDVAKAMGRPARIRHARAWISSAPSILAPACATTRSKPG